MIGHKQGGVSSSPSLTALAVGWLAIACSIFVLALCSWMGIGKTLPMLAIAVLIVAVSWLSWIVWRAVRGQASCSVLAESFESFGEPLWIFASDGRLLWANKEARAWRAGGDIFTAPEQEDSVRTALAGLQRALANGLPRKIDLSWRGEGGRHDNVLASVSPIAQGRAGLLHFRIQTAETALFRTLSADLTRLRTYLDTIPVGLYIADPKGSIRYANPALAHWLGRPVEEIVGQANMRVLPLDAAIAHTTCSGVEIAIQGDGQASRGLFRQIAFGDGAEAELIGVVMRDVLSQTDEVRTLKHAERRFDWIFEDAPSGIVLVDDGGRITDCNPTFLTLSRQTRSEAVGRLFEETLAPDFRSTIQLEYKRILQGELASVRLDAAFADQGDRMASLYVTPAREAEGISGLVIHVTDMTEQKNLEIQFAQSQKIQAMGQLAGGVAHDFNNLLTAMIGFCDLLLQRHAAGDPSFADIMQIRQNANRAASLVRQLLAFSRRQALQPRFFNVTDALADLSGLLRRLLGERIELKIIHGRDLGLIRVDPGQFDQVIINLAVNARDAMPQGGTLTIRTAAIHNDRPLYHGTEIMPPGDYVLIEVADTGTGIPADHLERIFEPFFSTKEVGAGTGLGLSTVYGILRQTDGFVFVESAMGRGATFLIYLPRIEDEMIGEQDRPALVKPSDIEEAAEDLTGTATILLVEDEDAVRLFSTRALRNKGYRVIEAQSAEGALELLANAQDKIDVLISDVVMPGMDGVSLAKKVRADHPDIRVILVSGYSEDLVAGGLENQPDLHFLPKPFTIKQLITAVKQLDDGEG